MERSSPVPRLPLTFPRNLTANLRALPTLVPHFPSTKRTSRTLSKHFMGLCHLKLFHHPIQHLSVPEPIPVPIPLLVPLHPILHQFALEIFLLLQVPLAKPAKEAHQQYQIPQGSLSMIHQHTSHDLKVDLCSNSNNNSSNSNSNGNGSHRVPMHQHHYALCLAVRKHGTRSLHIA
jgi:hypothetical protein